MASCFPFVKYIHLLLLFAICFTLMYDTTFEFLGIICFFIVNVIYSASIGIDITTELSKIYSGERDGLRWIVIVVIVSLIIALILNFTSSVFTLMTLGNLYSEFEAKGLPLMLSPEYRAELNSVKGMFMFSIVLITILTLRIFIAPTQMAYSVFEWLKYIPDEYSNMGHFILCLVAFGLLFAMYHLINTGRFNSISKDIHIDFPSSFKTNFHYLMFFLGLIMALYLLQPLFLLILYRRMGSTNTIYETAMNFTKNNSVSIFSFFIMFALFWILIFSILGLTVNKDTSKENTVINIVSLVGSICFIVGYLLLSAFDLTKHTQFALPTLIFFVFYYAFPPLLILATNKKMKNINFMINSNGNMEFIWLILLLAIIATLMSFGWIYYALINAISEIGKLNPGLTIFMYLFATLLLPFILYAGQSPPGFTGQYLYFLSICENMSNQFNNSFQISMVEAFNIVKGTFVGFALLFAMITIKEYTNLPRDTRKFTLYNNKFKLDSLFISLMVFLMIVLFTSFLNSDNFPLLLVATIEYMAPIVLLIMSALLIYYTDHLAKLSKKRVISDLEKQKKIKEDNRQSAESSQSKRINMALQMLTDLKATENIKPADTLLKEINNDAKTVTKDTVSNLRVKITNYKQNVNDAINPFILSLSDPPDQKTISIFNDKVSEYINSNLKPANDIILKL